MKFCSYVCSSVHNVCYIQDISNNTEIQIADFQMPPRMKKKGRPKGNGSIIGIQKVNPTPFIKKLEWEKSKCKDWRLYPI